MRESFAKPYRKRIRTKNFNQKESAKMKTKKKNKKSIKITKKKDYNQNISKI